MKKRFFISHVPDALPKDNRSPDFAVSFDEKYYWRGNFDPESQKYSYQTTLPKEFPERDLEEVSEPAFYRRLGKKAIAIRQFLKAYSNYLVKLDAGKKS